MFDPVEASGNLVAFTALLFAAVLIFVGSNKTAEAEKLKGLVVLTLVLLLGTTYFFVLLSGQPKPDPVHGAQIAAALASGPLEDAELLEKLGTPSSASLWTARKNALLFSVVGSMLAAAAVASVYVLAQLIGDGTKDPFRRTGVQIMVTLTAVILLFGFHDIHSPYPSQLGWRRWAALHLAAYVSGLSLVLITRLQVWSPFFRYLFVIGPPAATFLPISNLSSFEKPMGQRIRYLLKPSVPPKMAMLNLRRSGDF